MESEKLFDTREAATALGISGSMLRYLIAIGQAKPLRKIGLGWVFDAAEIERLRDRPQKGGRPKKQEVDQ